MLKDVLRLMLVAGLTTASAYAQLSLPKITATASGVSTRPITAAEAAAYTAAKTDDQFAKVSFRSARYPIDSMRAAVAQTASQWLVKLRQGQVRGIQLDPLGRVSVSAEQEAYAKTEIAARLATPGLSFADRAYTLRTAVEAFSDVYAPQRLPIAEAYLRDLNALGDSAATWQFEARQALLHTYYMLGRSADVIRHGTCAIALLNVMPFVNRNLEYERTDEEVYTATIDALTSLPNAHTRIEQVNTMLRTAAVPSPALIAADSTYYYFGLLYQRSASKLITGNAKLGTKGVPLVAHHWINRPRSDSATLLLDDGRIHVFEIAHTGCPGCVWALQGMQRLHERFPQIEALLMTWTMGYWGNRLIEPQEEIVHLRDYFVTNTKVTIPVGIWAGPKVPNEDGGMIPSEGPNLMYYPLFGKPMIWIVDGKGIIRRVFTGYSREVETQLVRTVEFLIRESAPPPLQHTTD